MSFIHTIAQNLATHADHALVTEVHGTSMVPANGRLLADLISRARGALRRAGAVPGDRVALLAPNSARWVAADLAALFEGLVVVPLYARQDPEELGFMISDCRPTVVLVADEELSEAIAPHRGDVPLVLFDDLFQGEPVADGPVERSAEDAVTIVYTSGTSGQPKGVVLSASNVDYMLPVTRDALGAMMGPREGVDRVYHYLPFCFAGSRVVLWTCLFRANGIHVSTDLDNLATEFKAVAPHYFLNVPMLLERIKNGVEAGIRERPAVLQALYDRAIVGWSAVGAGTAGRRDRLAVAIARRLIFARIREGIGAQLECLICGSAPLGPDTQRWFELVGIPVYQVYGLTETTAIVTMDVPPIVLPGHVGRALCGVETRLTDAGELVVRGPNVFQGYWERPDATAEAFEDGWFKTGDRATVDASGNWRIIGRAKNTLVPTSGHNIAPEPIEQSIVETLEGADAAVLIGHGRAFVTAVVSGESIDPARVQEAVRRVNEALPHYRRVRAWRIAPEPFSIENGMLTANRKLRRTVIEARLAAEIEAMYA